MSTFQIQDIIYTSDQLATQHVLNAEKIQSEPGITWGIDAIDARARGGVLPMRGGDVALIVGRPGDGKSTILSYLAMNEAMKIMEAGLDQKETVIYATWEGTVDMIYGSIMSSVSMQNGNNGYTSSDFYWGEVDLGVVQANVAIHGILPITMIGFSTFRKNPSIRLTLDVLLGAIRAIQQGKGIAKRKVTMVCADYLQLIPCADNVERTTQVSRAIEGAKLVGIDIDAPFYLGAQAHRRVDDYGVKLARMNDVQWSSQAEQHTDKQFSIWRPWRTEDVPQVTANEAVQIEVHGRRYDLTQQLLFMEMLKQRGDSGRHLWALYLRPELLRLAEFEIDIEEV